MMMIICSLVKIITTHIKNLIRPIFRIYIYIYILRYVQNFRIASYRAYIISYKKAPFCGHVSVTKTKHPPKKMKKNTKLSKQLYEKIGKVCFFVILGLNLV